MTTTTSNAVPRLTRQLSPALCAVAAALTAIGIATGLISFLTRSPIREVHQPGTSAWPQHLAVAAAACALYGLARWRRSRQPDLGGSRLLLLAPLGRSAASRLATALRSAQCRSSQRRSAQLRLAAAVLPLALIGYSFWRIGDQVIGGLDPNFTANAWGGPTYLGAMACHYLDATVIIAACAVLLDKILPAAA
ncbi:MAG TPA: hypothetical protein VFI65_04400 [Streptosporangiaceae bacterium]|nr:hypothetical protein [Streptosporangiaceae bacterium]